MFIKARQKSTSRRVVHVPETNKDCGNSLSKERLSKTEVIFLMPEIGINCPTGG